VGKCSLTVALPVLSAMGVEVAALPTAVLSTHTGGFTGFTYRDLTDDIAPMCRHWASLSLQVDAIYSGWLGSHRQAQLVSDAMDQLGKDALILVDPVMGDRGRLYGTITPDRVEGMRHLCAKAQVITPNLTEAAFLLDEPYDESAKTEAEIQGICRRLCEKLHTPQVVLTGVHTRSGFIGAAALDMASGEFSHCELESIPGMWHGTGDVFGSVLLGALLRGASLRRACELSVFFTRQCILRTAAIGSDSRYGLAFERALPDLLDIVRKEFPDD